MGRTEASSSASCWLFGDHVEEPSKERASSSSSSSEWMYPRPSSSSLSEMVLRLTVASSLPCPLPATAAEEGKGEDATRWPFREGTLVRLSIKGAAFSVLFVFTFPASLRWNQLIMGLLDLRPFGAFFGLGSSCGSAFIREVDCWGGCSWGFSFWGFGFFEVCPSVVRWAALLSCWPELLTRGGEFAIGFTALALMLEAS